MKRTLNKSEFARLIGVDESAIRRGLRRGRISAGPDGRIDPAQAKRWHDSRDPSKVRVGPKMPAAANEAAEGYGKLKTAILAIDLQIKRQEFRGLTGETMDRREAGQALTNYARLIRDKLVNFPNRYGAEIAAAIGSDPKLVMAELDRFMRVQLEEIANSKPDQQG